MAGNNVSRLAGARYERNSKELLDRLVEQDEAGEIVGMVVVTLCRHGRKKRYYLSTSGWAYENPTLAVGAMASCQALLQGAALEDAGLL